MVTDKPVLERKMIKNYIQKFMKCGIGVIPVGFRDKRPEFSKLPVNEENKPTWEIYKTRMPRDTELSDWFDHGTSNYGVVMGWNNLVVIDFDDMERFNKWRMWCSRTGGAVEELAEVAFQVVTGRGVHVYIRMAHKEKNRKLEKIDVKADGYVLGPGSVHPSGKEYRALREVWNFPLIRDLSDILPGSLLIQEQTRDTEHVIRQSFGIPPVADPWAAALASVPGEKNLVSRIRKQYRIEDFIRNVQVYGRWATGLCPLHEDHSPSFWIDTERQICGCFAGCTDKPMDVINLFARIYGLSNLEAINMLRQKL